MCHYSINAVDYNSTWSDVKKVMFKVFNALQLILVWKPNYPRSNSTFIHRL